RSKLNGSSTAFSRPSWAVSRLFYESRYADNSPAGPIKRSGFHHQDGQPDVQQAQRMHSYKPSRRARSCGDCRRSMLGAGVSLISQGRIFLYWRKNKSMSTIKSRMTGMPVSGRRISTSPPLSASDTRVMQARPFLPLMFMPSDPHTPSRQE